MRAWIPAFVVAVLLAIGVGTAAYFTFARGTGGTASPTPTVDLHSKQAVMAAVHTYYQIEDRVRQTGELAPIVAVTEGVGTPAYENLKAYLLDQSAKGRRSVTISDQLSDWAITVDGSTATASYTLVQRGHDTDATTGQPVEADMSTPVSHYKATLHLRGQTWLVYARDLVSRE